MKIIETAKKNEYWQLAMLQVLPNGDLIANAVPVVMLLSYAYDAPANPSAPSFLSSRLDRS